MAHPPPGAGAGLIPGVFNLFAGRSITRSPEIHRECWVKQPKFKSTISFKSWMLTDYHLIDNMIFKA